MTVEGREPAMSAAWAPIGHVAARVPTPAELKRHLRIRRRQEPFGAEDGPYAVLDPSRGNPRARPWRRVWIRDDDRALVVHLYGGFGEAPHSVTVDDTGTAVVVTVFLGDTAEWAADVARARAEGRVVARAAIALSITVEVPLPAPLASRPVRDGAMSVD